MEGTERRRRRLASFWIFAGVMHFVIPRQYEETVPAPLDRWKREIVAISGVAEIAGGVAASFPRTRRLARWWLLATLAAVFPANINMAVHAERFHQVPAALLWARLPFQGLFAWLVWRGTE